MLAGAPKKYNLLAPTKKALSSHHTTREPPPPPPPTSKKAVLYYLPTLLLPPRAPRNLLRTIFHSNLCYMYLGDMTRSYCYVGKHDGTIDARLGFILVHVHQSVWIIQCYI